jgi:hypothetical protein
MRGSLLSSDALRQAHHPETNQRAGSVQRQLARYHVQLTSEAGPAWTARAVFDRVVAPFCAMFGCEVVPAGGDATACHGLLLQDGSTLGAASAFAWGTLPDATWRATVRGGIGMNVRWCFAFAGPTLRIYDAWRTHSRRFVEFDLARVADDSFTFAVASALFRSATALDEAVALSDRHRAQVRDSLQHGVHDALRHLTSAFASAARGRRRAATSGCQLLDESLVVIYRILFLLFAEARGLVPSWHPVFRESYTIEALRRPAETLPRPRGLWETLQAIARLAHHGCHAGTLRVAPFNGRLFSPAHAPLADTVPLDDAIVRNALLALTTRPGKNGRERIAYGDLGVEQLGGVYERLLDFDVDVSAGRLPALVASGRRKATGSFYTPRSLTEYLVRRTLTPLIERATPDEILSLRVLDPAMGSGAFLVAACRFLAAAYESALIEEGGVSSGDLSDADRATFRRAVAQRCLFGVDLNPMAVQLARLSLWLATLSGDRPLTFFDHHLRTGNSLVGASMIDVRGRLPGRAAVASPLPLFEDQPIQAQVRDLVRTRAFLRDAQEDTLEQVRRKETVCEALQADDAPLAAWKAIADLWCAGWFDPRARRFTRATYEALIDRANGRQVLSDAVAEDVLRHGREVASAERFFHWQLEFPEVFHADNGEPLDRPGFDAVIGNPPWEMLRGDSGDQAARGRGARAGSALTRFARESGIYPTQGSGHANAYQLFVERSLALLRRGGRLGLVLPSGFASDHGCAALRRHVFLSTVVDSFVVVENREALFQIHRGLKFVLMTATKRDGGTEATAAIPVRSGVRSASEFDRLPDSGTDHRAVPAPMALIRQLSGDQLAIPELGTPLDARIASHIAFSFPAAGDDAGWGLRFGRELNATDDRAFFSPAREGLPVIEGKHVRPFAVDVAAARHHVAVRDAARILPGRPFEQPRLAYRDVASSTNRLTLIAAVLPAGTVTTHTLFCLKTALDDEAQQFLAGMFNSFVANYMVRLRVTTHVTVAIVDRLPLPKPPRQSGDFKLVVECARTLMEDPGHEEAYMRLQGAVARLYELDARSFAHVVQSFPLIDENLRAKSLAGFDEKLRKLASDVRRQLPL